MTAVADLHEGVIHAVIEIAAPPARVFEALTTPAQLASWWGSAETYRTEQWTIDLRPGGAWRCIAKNARDGQVSTVADPTRRAILDRLKLGGAPVHELADGFPVSRPAISKHLRVLREAHLVRERRDGRERIYELNPAPLRDVAGWIEGYRAFWASNPRLAQGLRRGRGGEAARPLTISERPVGHRPRRSALAGREPRLEGAKDLERLGPPTLIASHPSFGLRRTPGRFVRSRRGTACPSLDRGARTRRPRHRRGREDRVAQRGRCESAPRRAPPRRRGPDEAMAGSRSWRLRRSWLRVVGNERSSTGLRAATLNAAAGSDSRRPAVRCRAGRAPRDARSAPRAPGARPRAGR